MNTYFTGLIAAPHTPFFADGSLNLDMVEQQAEWLIENGVTGAFVGGTTGESLSMTVDERIELAQRWSEVVQGSPLKLIVHVGHNCLAESIALAQHAQDLQPNAIAVMAPSFFKPNTVEDLIEFCGQIADQAQDLPFYYYDIPSMTNVRLNMVEFLDRGATRIPRLTGLKYTNPDLVQLQECLAFQHGLFNVLFGCDELLLAGLALGAPGAVGSGYNFAAKLYRKIIEAFQAGDMQTAQKYQVLTVKLVRLLMSYGYLPASKCIMEMLGIDCGPVRLPLKNLTPEQKTQLRLDLAPFGLLSDVEITLPEM